MRPATIASITFPTVLRSAIGRQPPASWSCAVVFPGFRSTVTLASRNRRGKYSSFRLAWARLARTLCNGSPHALRNPIGIPSRPGAFHGLARFITPATCSGVTWLSISIVWPNVLLSNVRSWISSSTASVSGRNRFLKMSVFSLCVKAVGSDSSSIFRGGILGGSGLQWLRVLAHFANAHTFWGLLDASCTALRQLWRLASAIAFCIRCKAALNCSQATWERVLYQRLSSDLASTIASFTLRFHHGLALPLFGFRRGVETAAIRWSSSISKSSCRSISSAVFTSVGHRLPPLGPCPSY